MAGTEEHPERRRYYPDDEDVPLSTAICQAIEAHEDTAATVDELDLFAHVNPRALDMLFADAPESDVEISVQLNLTNVTVSI